MGSTLRERKKQQTRQEISDVATRLFIERGFDAVTIAQIAAAADVAKMTVTNHFPRKEDLLLDLHEAMVRWPAETVANRAPGQSVLAALREAYFDALERRDPLLGFSGPAFAGLVLGSPTLVARLREIDEHREHALAEAIAGEGASADRPSADGPSAESGGDPPPLLVAAQLNATQRALFQEVLRRTAAGESHDQVAQALEPLARQAFDLLEPALGRYGIADEASR